MIWLPLLKHQFQVKSYYKALRSKNGSVQSFLWTSFGKHKLHPSVAFFTWNVALGKILTTDNYRRWGITIADWCCCMCKSTGEFGSYQIIFGTLYTSWIPEWLLSFWQLFNELHLLIYIYKLNYGSKRFTFYGWKKLLTKKTTYWSFLAAVKVVLFEMCRLKGWNILGYKVS